MKQQDEVQVIYLKARASSSSEAWSYIDRFDAEAGPAFDGRDDVSLDWHWWRFSPTAFITYAASSDEAMSACRAAVDAVLTDLRVDFPGVTVTCQNKDGAPEKMTRDEYWTVAYTSPFGLSIEMCCEFMSAIHDQFCERQ